MKSHIAWIDDVHELTVIGDLSTYIHKQDSPVIYIESTKEYIQTNIDEIINETTINVRFHEELPMGEKLFLLWDDLKIPVYPGSIVRTKWFDEKYTNLDITLGANCNKYSTTFAVWAPTATQIKVIIDNQCHRLNKMNKGTWKLILDGDLHGAPYEYEVTVNGETTIVNDPYAKALLANSSKGVIVDFSRTKQLNAADRPKISHLQDAIIYELHVRDATIHKNSGVKKKGKFLGLSELNTTTRGGASTALSYIKQLGCTHVQLLPINDFARVDELKPEKSYNWGYDPLFYQVPEGSYSRTPEDAISRINECKTMIDAFHQEGLSVVLDVVYNHVFIMEESPFEKLVPGYYFRYHPDGTLSNGTGVGNDIATERQMVRKFILDTIDLWLREYKADGFRFDLMGEMDAETIKQIVARCKSESVPIMLLGEGWDLPTALAAHQKATSSNSHQLQGVRFFNDLFRDSLKGNLFNHEDKGYVNGHGRFIERLPHLVSGSALVEFGIPFVSDVVQTVNYVECHDNHTLWDRLLLTNSEENENSRKKMHQLGTAITLLSQGVPFIHAGQEWFRSKQGDENSYISSDEINQLDWNKREEETENIAFVKALIQLRKQHNIFRMTSKQEIRRRLHVLKTPKPVFGFMLLGDNEDFSIYVNPTNQKHALHLPSSGKWQVTITNDYPKMQENHLIVGEYAHIGAYELIVLKKVRKPTMRKESKLELIGSSKQE